MQLGWSCWSLLYWSLTEFLSLHSTGPKSSSRKIRGPGIMRSLQIANISEHRLVLLLWFPLLFRKSTSCNILQHLVISCSCKIRAPWKVWGPRHCAEPGETFDWVPSFEFAAPIILAIHRFCLSSPSHLRYLNYLIGIVWICLICLICQFPFFVFFWATVLYLMYRSPP
jgi:hypothetical protein